MSAQYTPGRTGGTARLWPVCPASNEPYENYGSSIVKDTNNRAPCPVCRKVVKLKKVSGHGPWPNTIPHHHAQPIGSRDAQARHEKREALRLCDKAIQWVEGGGKISLDELNAIRAAIVKATGSAS